MIYTLRHRTIYQYDAPVSFAQCVLRLTPRSSGTQTVLRSAITVEPRPAQADAGIGPFGERTLRFDQPLVATNRGGQYDVTCTVSGGGLSGQAGAVRHGLAKALTYFEPDLRGPLKRGGFLTRDPRVVERKKYGHPKARRSFQFSKR